jgi:hypothetical protein
MTTTLTYTEAVDALVGVAMEVDDLSQLREWDGWAEADAPTFSIRLTLGTTRTKHLPDVVRGSVQFDKIRHWPPYVVLHHLGGARMVTESTDPEEAAIQRATARASYQLRPSISDLARRIGARSATVALLGDHWHVEAVGAEWRLVVTELVCDN